ncbi:hypothetical protein [Komagataeibacter sp. NFXK3]
MENNQPIAEIGPQGFATKAGYLTIYNYDSYGCYRSNYENYFSIGVGHPAYSTLQAPPEHEKGKVAVWDEKTQKWSLIDDYRGQEWYSKKDGSPYIISEPGKPDESLYSKTPIPASSFLKQQAQGELEWCAIQFGIAKMLDEKFTPNMSKYINIISDIYKGIDKKTAVLPKRPTDIFDN